MLLVSSFPRQLVHCAESWRFMRVVCYQIINYTLRCINQIELQAFPPLDGIVECYKLPCVNLFMSIDRKKENVLRCRIFLEGILLATKGPGWMWLCWCNMKF